MAIAIFYYKMATSIESAYNIVVMEDVNENGAEEATQFLMSSIGNIDNSDLDDSGPEERFYSKHKRPPRNTKDVAEALYLNTVAEYDLKPNDPIIDGIEIYSIPNRSRKEPLVFITNQLSEDSNKRIFKNRTLNDDEAVATIRALDELLDPHYQAFANRERK